ncbi:hypothetical protein [Aestuariibaculum suncheonense]|uniref:NIPSNAP domain-containing protein n=1 Tax=Aestuariibaculum suncheonense TaxID=1028745 RepID=A0A8J6UGA8_9FLAO|nr:hypothetical protein [Aestuariibaculum suncheonense]MBD0834899.1 hypothetical protein [Aestuariibaculum suncheonense]
MRTLLYLLLVLPLLGVSQETNNYMLNMSEITVKPGHNSPFKEGVMSWKKCYKDNEGEFKWSMWKRVQGKGIVYTMTSRMDNWAEMDENNDEAGKKCRMKVVDLILPHVESVEYNIAKRMPDVSKSNSNLSSDTKLVWVYNVKVDNYDSFMETVKEVESTIKKAEGDARGTWYSVIGGAPEVSDFFVVVPFKNFAALDEDRDGVWKVYENEKGKSKADAIKENFRSAVSKDWSYMYSLIEDLSY